MATDVYEFDKTAIANYASFAAWISAMGVANKSIIIATDTEITGTVNVPSNIEIKDFYNGAKFTGTGTLTINKMSCEPEHQIFASTLTNPVLRKKHIRPEWFGAVGDDVANDSAAIIAADTCAFNSGSKVRFSNKTYLCTGVSPSVNWSGNNTTLKKYNPDNVNIYSFITWVNKTGLKVNSITFDGNVSADPVSWNSGNFDTFTGSIAIYINNCSGLHFQNCRAINSRWHAVYMQDSDDCVFDNLYVNKARGTFGDGVYIQHSDDIKINNAFIYDVTRIGLVTEGNTDGPSANCVFSNVTSEYAHDSSSLYGGLEGNAGFWYENSNGHQTINCVAKNTSYGFQTSTGVRTTERTHHQFTGCTAYNCADYGYVAFSNNANKLTNVIYVNCKALDSRIGFDFSPANDLDTATYIGCTARYDNTTDYGAGFAAVGESAFVNYVPINITNCIVEHMYPLDRTALNNGSHYASDIQLCQDGKFNIKVNNLSNVDSTVPIYVKGLIGDHSYDIVNTFVYIRAFRTYAASKLTNCNIYRMYPAGTADLTIDNCKFILGCNIFNTGKVTIRNCKVDFSLVNEVLTITRSDDAYDAKVIIDGCDFTKDINANGFIISVDATNTNKPKTLMKNCYFYNTGSATNTKAFFEIHTSGAVFYCENVYMDSNVTYFHQIDTTMIAMPEGVTKIPVHSGGAKTEQSKSFNSLYATNFSMDNIRFTPEGGIAHKYINGTGANSVKGTVVHITGDNTVDGIVVNVPDPIGVVYESGIANGSEMWIVTEGKAECLVIGTCTAGQLARGFVTGDAGYVKGSLICEAVPTAPFATDKHFYEFGHVNTGRTGAGLAMIQIHKL